MSKQLIFALIILSLIGIDTNTLGCSAVFLDKKGQYILGNNNDWITGEGIVLVNKRNVVKRGFWYKNDPEWKWTSKYGSITFNFEGPEFPIREVNEAGLAIVELMLTETKHPPSGGLPVLAGSQWFQYQLDKSATIEDVIASDTVVRMEATDWEGMASHYLICDSTGRVAGFEWLDGHLTIYTGKDLPIPAMVNSSYMSCITNGNDPSGRFKPIADMYAAYDTVKSQDGIEYVFSILQAATLYSPPTQTRWSMAYDVRARRYYWKTNINTSLRYLDINDFDFSCGSDRVMLDVNSSDSGNVRNAFVPFIKNSNSDLVRRTYALYNDYSWYTGRVYPDDTIEAIITFPESTYCENTPVKAVNRNATNELQFNYDPKFSSINIVFPGQLSNGIAISFFDLYGRIITPNIERKGRWNQKNFIYRIHHITPGVYYCKVVTGNNTFVKSFVVQR